MTRLSILVPVGTGALHRRVNEVQLAEVLIRLKDIAGQHLQEEGAKICITKQEIQFQLVLNSPSDEHRQWVVQTVLEDAEWGFLGE